MAVVPGTILPLRNSKGETVATCEASESLIRGSIASFLGMLLNVDHQDPIATRIGVGSRVYYENGMIVEGDVYCPIWKEKILSGKYSGVSIEGSIIGDDISKPQSMSVYAISFLTTERNPKGGACPTLDANGNPMCVVEIIQDNEDEDEAILSAAWTPNYESFWSYIETDGKINQSKAKKIFLKKTGDGTNRGDWHYPIAHMTESGPEPDSEGLMAAYKRAAQQGETGLFSKIRSKMRSIQMEIPEGLKASKLEASFDKSTQTFSAKIVDENNEVLSEKNIIIINDSNKGDEMKKKEEIVVEAAAVVETPAVVVVPEVVEVPPSPEVVVEAAGLIDASVVVPTPAAVEVPLAPVIEAPVAEPKKLDWELVSQEIGIKSKDEFTLIKQNADKIPDLEKKIDLILKENEGLREYKDTQTKKFLLENYPPAVVRDIAASFAEYTKDPAAFTQKYDEDRVKFAASKSVKLAGSAAESELTDEARRALEVKNAVSYLKRRNGFRV
jgi:hypothetical protein